MSLCIFSTTLECKTGKKESKKLLEIYLGFLKFTRYSRLVRSKFL